MPFGGQFAFEGSKLVLERLFDDPEFNLYVGLVRKRGEPVDQQEVINDETEMDDIEPGGELDDSYFEENDTGYSRKEVSNWNDIEAPSPPSDPAYGDYEGDKPAQITNAEAIEFGPWDTGHMDEDGNPTHTSEEEADPDEIVAVFLTTDETGYEGDFIAYQNISMGHQVKEGETLRVPENRLVIKIN